MKKWPSTAIDRAASAAAIVPIPILGHWVDTWRRWFTTLEMPRCHAGVKLLVTLRTSVSSEVISNDYAVRSDVKSLASGGQIGSVAAPSTA